MFSVDLDCFCENVGTTAKSSNGVRFVLEWVALLYVTTVSDKISSWSKFSFPSFLFAKMIRYISVSVEWSLSTVEILLDC